MYIAFHQFNALHCSIGLYLTCHTALAIPYFELHGIPTETQHFLAILNT